MPSKTISIEVNAYNRLVATRRPGESFTAVINRITLPPAKSTSSDLLKIKEWGKGVDWSRVERAVSRRRRSRDIRPIT
ncbi:MAG: antitoxin VapB family protein [Verrucomicrobiota bacterium]